MYAVRVAARLQPQRRVVCFEPVPANFERIKENAALNGLSDRIDVDQVALSDAEGEVALVLREDFESGSETGNASIAISEAADRDMRRIVVPTRRFDDIRAERAFGSLPVVKVDIEGHEDFFFAGAARYLNEERPVILTEVNNWFYEKRGTTSSSAFSANLPEGYTPALLRTASGRCTLSPCHMDDLAGLRRIETCVLIPAERRRDVEAAIR